MLLLVIVIIFFWLRFVVFGVVCVGVFLGVGLDGVGGVVLVGVFVFFLEFGFVVMRFFFY